MLTPEGRPSVPCPTYPEIRLSLMPQRSITATIDSYAPDAIHIATEGPLGMATRRYCLRAGYPFTTSFHTKFPEYVEARWGLPARFGYAWLRHFHSAARAVMVATPTFKAELEAHGFQRVSLWSRGVDLEVFGPGERTLPDAPRPVLLYVGRVAIEKNLRAFLDLKTEGSKWVVGDGPQLAELRAAYPKVNFVGKQSQHLADYYRSADVFVFPSRTDTFGLVMIEAMACGTPVAAYPVAGPLDIVGGTAAGALDDDLDSAVRRALSLSRADARARAEHFSWSNATAQFFRHLQVIGRSIDATFHKRPDEGTQMVRRA